MSKTQWTAGNGSVIAVEAAGQGSFAVSVDGGEIKHGRINKGMPVPAAATKAGIVVMLTAQGTYIGLNAERKALLESMDAEATAEWMRVNAKRLEIDRLKYEYEKAETALREHGYGATGERGRAVERALAALAAAQAE